MAAARLQLLNGIPLLDINEQVADVADELVQKNLVPVTAVRDAIHIAAASVHQMQFLLTWNCKHIANPRIRAGIRACISRHRIEFPVICTPEEFIGDDDIDPQIEDPAGHGDP
jgi:hypothetical protein